MSYELVVNGQTSLLPLLSQLAADGHWYPSVAESYSLMQYLSSGSMMSGSRGWVAISHLKPSGHLQYFAALSFPSHRQEQ